MPCCVAATLKSNRHVAELEAKLLQQETAANKTASLVSCSDEQLQLKLELHNSKAAEATCGSKNRALDKQVASSGIHQYLLALEICKLDGYSWGHKFIKICIMFFGAAWEV